MTEANPYVSKLFIYPIKSLDGVKVDRAIVLKSGALKGDRTWAIFDSQGNFVNGKRNQSIHALRSQFDLATNRVTLWVKDKQTANTFSMETERQQLENWLSDYFAFAVSIKQNLDLGFPDDTVSPGATIISTATIKEIASWYPAIDSDEIRRRFRANIEIDGVPAFWEDRLFGKADTTVDFKIGRVRFMGVNPCKRCVVISRDSLTGIPSPKFQQTFIRKRQETLPDWVDRSRFNHYYRLAINTRLSTSEAGKTISVGDRAFI